MRKLLLGTMCLMLVLFVGTSMAEPEQGSETCLGVIVVNTIPYTDSGVLGQTDDCSGRPYFDVFYRLTASVAGTYIFDMCNSYGDTYLRIWTSGACCSGSSVSDDDACGGLDPQTSIVLALNQVVYIECGSYYSSGYAGQAYNFNITGPQASTPGDNCTIPKTVSIPAQLPYSDSTQTTCGRINNYNTTCLGFYDDGEDIIYQITVTTPVTVDIAMHTNTSYTGMCIANTCPPGASCINMSTYIYSGWQFMYYIPLNAGTYWIMVDNGTPPSCIPSFDLYITAAPPPPPQYYWANSCGQGTGTPHPRYDWVTETAHSVTTGPSYTPQDGILGDGDWEGPFPIGFTFNYYGVDYTTFIINSEGYVTLGNFDVRNFSNVCIPNADRPNNMLAWFWDNLDAYDGSPRVYYGNGVADGHNALIVTFQQYDQHGSYVSITAQVILKDNNNIKYQYQTIEPGWITNRSTIGIENYAGLVGINYLCSGAGGNCFGEGLAIEFGPDQTHLPVELTSFGAVAMNEAIHLNWVTASETNNDHFAVYRSTSAVGEFAQIATLNGAGSTANESRYDYIDRNLINGVTYYYLLADVDINGNVNNHDQMINATPTNGALGIPVTEYCLYQNYPNPFNPITTITYDVKETGHVTLKVYNILGKEVATLVDEVKDNNRYQVTFDASGLAAGVYFYRVNVNDFSDVHKMILLK
jgi:hypothetical protein